MSLPARLLVAALLLWGAPASAAVAVDATGTEGNSAGVSVTSLDYTGLTIGAGLSNGALICMATFDSNVSASSMKWDNTGTPQSLTLLKDQANAQNSHATVWGLLNPTSGNKTLHVAWTTGSSIGVACVSVSGAGSFGNTNGGTATGTSLSFNVTGATGDMVFGSWTITNAGNISSNNGTSIFIDNVNVGGAGASANRAAGAATVSMTMTTDNGTSVDGGAGADVVAAAPCKHTLALMGVGC